MLANKKIEVCPIIQEFMAYPAQMAENQK